MMKNKVAMLVIVFLALFVCSAVFAYAAPGGEVTLQSQNNGKIELEGTIWGGKDSDGDYYEYYFRESGVVYYKSPSGFFKDGVWRLKGNSLYMAFNNKYSERQGIIVGKHMEGRAWNTVGKTWSWAADRIY